MILKALKDASSSNNHSRYCFLCRYLALSLYISDICCDAQKIVADLSLVMLFDNRSSYLRCILKILAQSSYSWLSDDIPWHGMCVY